MACTATAQTIRIQYILTCWGCWDWVPSGWSCGAGVVSGNPFSRNPCQHLDELCPHRPTPTETRMLRWEIHFSYCWWREKRSWNNESIAATAVARTPAPIPTKAAMAIINNSNREDVKTVLTANSNSTMGEVALNRETKEWQCYSKKCSSDEGTKEHNDIKHIKKNVVNSTNSNAWVHMILAINFTYIEIPDVRPFCRDSQKSWFWSDATWRHHNSHRSIDGTKHIYIYIHIYVHIIMTYLL